MHVPPTGTAAKPPAQWRRYGQKVSAREALQQLQALVPPHLPALPKLAPVWVGPPPPAATLPAIPLCPAPPHRLPGPAPAGRPLAIPARQLRSAADASMLSSGIPGQASLLS
eukprot:EG_transcript_6176